MIPFVQQLFAQRYGLRKLLMNATWGDRRHIRVSAPVETIGKFARGPNLAVGFWKVTLNRVHRYLRFEFCRPQRAIAPIGCFLLIFFLCPWTKKEPEKSPSSARISSIFLFAIHHGSSWPVHNL